MDQPLFQAPEPTQTAPTAPKPDTTHQKPIRAPRVGWIEKLARGRVRASIRIDGKRHSKTFTDPDQAVEWLDSMNPDA